MRILVIGGGIGGLSAAAFLERDRHQITLIEKRSAWPATGYAIGLWTNGLEILRKLDLEAGVSEIGRVASYQRTANSSGKVLSEMNFEELNQKYGSVVRFVNRTPLIQLMESRLSSTIIRKGITAQEFLNLKDSIRVTFSDGQKDEFDFVIGADGTNSQMRKVYFGDGNCSYPGAAHWAFIIPKSAGIEIPEGCVELFGRGKMVGFYPFASDGCGVFACMAAPPTLTDSLDTRIERLRENFEEFGWLVPAVLKSLTNPDEIHHGHFKEVEVDCWYRNRMILLGDSAHSLLPTTGQGASIALEDGYVFSEELRSANSNDLNDVFARFQVRREERIRKIRARSRLIIQGLVHESKALCYLRDMYIKLSSTSLKLKNFEKFLATQI